jgi:hypothetical protein
VVLNPIQLKKDYKEKILKKLQVLDLIKMEVDKVKVDLMKLNWKRIFMMEQQHLSLQIIMEH